MAVFGIFPRATGAETSSTTRISERKTSTAICLVRRLSRHGGTRSRALSATRVATLSPSDRTGKSWLCRLRRTARIVGYAPREIRSRFVCPSSGFRRPVCVRVRSECRHCRPVAASCPTVPEFLQNDFGRPSRSPSPPPDRRPFVPRRCSRARSAVMSREYYNLRFVVTTPTLSVTEYNCLKEPCNQVRCKRRAAKTVCVAHPGVVKPTDLPVWRSFSPQRVKYFKRKSFRRLLTGVAPPLTRRYRPSARTWNVRTRWSDESSAFSFWFALAGLRRKHKLYPTKYYAVTTLSQKKFGFFFL